MRFLVKIFLFSSSALSTPVISAPPADRASTATLYANNRYPLLPKPYIELPLGAIEPAGEERNGRKNSFIISLFSLKIR